MAPVSLERCGNWNIVKKKYHLTCCFSYQQIYLKGVNFKALYRSLLGVQINFAISGYVLLRLFFLVFLLIIKLAKKKLHYSITHFLISESSEAFQTSFQSLHPSAMLQQHYKSGYPSKIFTGTHINTGVVYQKAAIEPLLTLRAICFSVVKHERQPSLQLSNPNTIECVLSFLLSLNFSLPPHITMSHDSESGISLYLFLPPPLLRQV